MRTIVRFFRKHIKLSLLIAMLLIGAANSSKTSPEESYSASRTEGGAISANLTAYRTQESATQQELSSEEFSEEYENVVEGPSLSSGMAVFRYEDIPDYTFEPFVQVNEGAPYFGQELINSISAEYYAELDYLGRAGTAIALIGKETIPTEPRRSTGDIRPTGWQFDKYEEIDGNYLYNRCHLIAWQLSGETSNPRNIITGTRYLNIVGMAAFENEIANYVKETGNHVLYRVTPVFVGEELVARGVLLEAQSIEDNNLCFNVYCYNVQPDIAINYSTGESSPQREETINTLEIIGDIAEDPAYRTGPGSDTALISEESLMIPEVESEPEPVAQPEIAPLPQEQPQTQPQPTVTYIGNRNTGKFHYHWCSSVDQMSEHNKVFFGEEITRDDIVNQGYQACKRCKP